MLKFHYRYLGQTDWSEYRAKSLRDWWGSDYSGWTTLLDTEDQLISIYRNTKNEITDMVIAEVISREPDTYVIGNNGENLYRAKKLSEVKYETWPGYDILVETDKLVLLKDKKSGNLWAYQEVSA